MASISSVAFALASLAATAVAQSAFSVSAVTSHQPTGAKDGNVDYYNMGFNVNSTISGSQSAYCHVTWGDNSYTSQNATSDAVPIGSWIQCDSSSANFGDKNSEFQFQLFSPFAIGDYSFEVRQSYSNAIATSYPWRIQNTSTTFSYPCTINPQEVSSFQVHASGDCALAAGAVLKLSVASTSTTTSATSTTSAASTPTPTSPTAACGNKVEVSFAVNETTAWGQTVLIAGNITELGSWAPANALVGSSYYYTSANHLWAGGVTLTPGTAFEYKYILRGSGPTYTWESGANRVFVIPDTCDGATAGSNPDTFRQ